MTRQSAHRALGTVVAAAATYLVGHVALSLVPMEPLVTHWWLATALATGALLVLPRRWLLPGAGATAVLVGAAVWSSATDPLPGAALAVGSAVEVVVVVGIVAGAEVRPPRLAAWSDVRRWMLGVLAGASACAVVVAVAQAGQPDPQPWRTLVGVAVTHVAAQVLVLPVFAALAGRRFAVPIGEVLAHLALLAAGTTLFLSASTDQPVAYLLLPLLAWAASRFPPWWAAAELYAVALGALLTSRMDRGPLGSIGPEASLVGVAASAQTFVAIAGITSVTFVVATQALRESARRDREHEARLGQLLDSADGTAFVATDLRGTVTWFSPGAERLTGWNAEDLVGRRDPLVLHDAREVLARSHVLGVLCDYGVVTAPVRQGGVSDTRDWTYVHRDGHRMTVSLNVSPVRGRDGRMEGFLSVVRDVTDRRAAEQALVLALDKERETIRRMQELDRAKSDFVSSVSHELRTPLTSIIGYTELLRSGVAETLSHSQEHLMEKIDRNSGRLLNLVEDLLTLAQAEDGQLRVEKTDTDLVAAVRSATEEMAHAARQGGVALHLRVPSRQVLLEGDARQLERLVLNLVSNAVKFTPSGGRVDVRLGLSGGDAVVEVADTGVGIPEAELDQLFGRFFRSTTATENAIQGTGLGLSIVRSIAEAHDGTIEVVSEVGVGTSFVLRLPVAVGVADGVAEGTARPRALAEPDLDGAASGCYR